MLPALQLSVLQGPMLLWKKAGCLRNFYYCFHYRIGRGMLDLNLGVVVLLSTIVALLFRGVIKDYHNVLLFFDSIGLGFFRS